MQLQLAAKNSEIIPTVVIKNKENKIIKKIQFKSKAGKEIELLDIDKTGNFYIKSSNSNIIYVYNRKGQNKKVIKLEPNNTLKTIIKLATILVVLLVIIILHIFDV